MMTILFLILLVLCLVALLLAVPFGLVSLQFVTVLAVCVGAAILWMIYTRVKDTIAWINGKPVPDGQPGQVTRGVHFWITKSTFEKGPDASLGDPDPNKPIEPPPSDF